MRKSLVVLRMQENLFEIARQRDNALEKAGWLKLNEIQRTSLIKKFRRGPWTLEEHHFKYFIMLVKHVKNNQFKFYKDTEKVKNEYR